MKLYFILYLCFQDPEGFVDILRKALLRQSSIQSIELNLESVLALSGGNDEIPETKHSPCANQTHHQINVNKNTEAIIHLNKRK